MLIKRLISNLENFQSLLSVKEENFLKPSIESDSKKAISSNANSIDSEKKQSLPSLMATTNSNTTTTPTNANKHTNNGNLNINSTATPNAGSYTNISTNDKNKALYLSKNSEINNIKAVLSANKKEQEKEIQALHRKSIFILLMLFYIFCRFT